MRFDNEAQNRLESYGGEYYMSNRYFLLDERNYLFNLPTASGATAKESLAALFTSTRKCALPTILPHHGIRGLERGMKKKKSFLHIKRNFCKRNGTF